MAKIYTKKGDTGNTSRFNGSIESKGELIYEASGTLDELNSWVGLLRDHQIELSLKDFLKKIQENLFNVGSQLAVDDEEIKSKMPNILEIDIEILENEIDRMDLQLKPLRYFILPGGHPVLSYTHLARTVCRRAERTMVRLGDEQNFLAIKYLNRLSDYLFTLARYTAKEMNIEEVKWNAPE